MECVDIEGWDGATGCSLLTELRHQVVLPLVAQIGLRSLAAEQAAATGWEVGWEVLRAPSTRAAVSPWGVVWVAVRRAILNERIATAYAATPREACRQAAGDDNRQLVNIDALRDTGWEPCVDERPAETLIPLMVDLMVKVGWERIIAQDVMEAVADAAPWRSDRGWRWIVHGVDAEPWQIRRLIAVLRHSQLEALLHDRDCAVTRERVLALLRSTRVRRPPARMADLGLAGRLAS